MTTEHDEKTRALYAANFLMQAREALLAGNEAEYKDAIDSCVAVVKQNEEIGS